MTPEAASSLRQVRWLLGLFIAGLVVSGLTALPLEAEVSGMVNASGARELVANNPAGAPAWSVWLVRVETALRAVHHDYPFLAYGTDWLAFGHLMIALAFVGAWRDPVRNVWLFHFGLIACALVVPWAMVWGAVRGIPFWWRLMDCSFGVLGAIPLWWALRKTRRLEALTAPKAPSAPC